MIRVCVLSLVLACTAALSSYAASLDRTEVFDLYSQGKDLFRRANDLVLTDPKSAKEHYQKAAMRFERIAQEGEIHNGKLYYNIGNAYFRMGDIGRAILYYRRAQLLTPNDVNLRQNLSYARSKRVDRIDEKEETKVLKTLFFWHYDLSTKTRLMLFAVCFAMLWICASIRLFTQKSLLSWGIVVSAVLAGCVFGSLLTESIASSRNIGGVILAEEVIARKGDGETYQPSFKAPLHAGTEFRLVEDRSQWWHVELADGRRCWVPEKDAERIRSE